MRSNSKQWHCATFLWYRARILLSPKVWKCPKIAEKFRILVSCWKMGKNIDIWAYLSFRVEFCDSKNDSDSIFQWKLRHSGHDNWSKVLHSQRNPPKKGSQIWKFINENFFERSFRHVSSKFMCCPQVIKQAWPLFRILPNFWDLRFS